ncbi:MAG: FecR family protein [Reichenbachiella sp.]
MGDNLKYDWSYMAKLMSNELDQAEEQLFYQELEHNITLQVEFETFNQHWQQMDEATIKSEADVNLAWVRQEKMILDHEKKSNIWPTVLRLAAVFILVSGLAYVFYSNSASSITIETAAYEEQKIVLPDGTTVFLNENTSISYHDDYNTHRHIELQGEAFFDVVRDEFSPFTVSMDNGTVQVLGTSFYINSNKDEATVFVKTGKVSYQLSKTEKEYILTPGWTAVSTKDSTVVLKNKNPNILSWQDKHMYFDEMALTDVLKVIENTFKTTLIYQERELKNCSLSAEYNNLPLANVLEVIQTIFSLEIDYNENIITITGGNCESL